MDHPTGHTTLILGKFGMDSVVRDHRLTNGRCSFSLIRYCMPYPESQMLLGLLTIWNAKPT